MNRHSLAGLEITAEAPSKNMQMQGTSVAGFIYSLESWAMKTPTAERMPLYGVLK
jgi:hypothetical protein